MVTSASGRPLGRVLIPPATLLGRTESRRLTGAVSQDTAWEAGRERCSTGREERERRTDSLAGWDSPNVETRMGPATLPAAFKSSPLAQKTFSFYA